MQVGEQCRWQKLVLYELYEGQKISATQNILYK
jgi:hypothetical protein